MEGTPKQPKNCTSLLEQLVTEARESPLGGQVADYIPALAEVAAEHVGIAVVELDGTTHTAGNFDVCFSIQSISKIFGLALAMERAGDSLWERVRMEPSGQAFNSVVQLEWEHGIPRNPFINAGAIVVSDILTSRYSASKSALIQYIRYLADTESVHTNHEVWESEKEHGNRNAALAYLMKSFGNIEADVPSVLDHYFFQCSVEMNCLQLAQSLGFLANKGIQPGSEERICDARSAHRINALLSTSGMYDQSGEFAFTVGLPAKSGVGGGIVAVVPDYGVIAAWSPPLNRFGNPTRAVQMVTEFAQRLGLSVYH